MTGRMPASLCWSRPAADVDGARIIAADREPQNWMINGRTYSEQHFSPLEQINDHTVGKLGLAWYLDLESRIGTEATPLVVDGVKTWTVDWCKSGGGGTTWDGISYDPQLNLLYVGTGNGSPWPRELRSPGGGDNLFLCSIIALDADSGAYRWHYQAIPAESWDFDCVQQMTLAELPSGGRMHKVLMQAGKNGFFYVLDRTSGKLLSAHNFVPVNWASGIDPTTGRPIETAKEPYGVEQTRLISTGIFGAHAWHAMSYSPLTRLVYIPAEEDWFRYARAPRYEHHEMKWNLGLNYRARDPAGMADPPRRGYLLAWNPVSQSEAWRIDLHGPWNGSVLTTAGNLLIQGAADGRFVAYSADKGGARADKGMAPFADVLNEQDAEAIHAFIIEQARLIANSRGGAQP